MNKKVSILFVAQSNYNNAVTHMCLANAIKNAGIPVELCFFNNSPKNKKTEVLAQKIMRSNNLIYCSSKNELSEAAALNILLQKCTGQYICVIPQPVLLAQNWAYDLVWHIDNLPDTGVAAIHTHGKRGWFGSYLDINDQIINVWEPLNGFLYGILMFSRQILETIGGFDPTLNCGYEYMQYTYRLHRSNFANYFIFNHGSIVTQVNEIKHIDQNTATSIDDYDENIKQLNQAKNFTYKISEMSQNESLAYANIEGLREKLHVDYSQTLYVNLTNQFGILLKQINNKGIDHVNHFCATYSLKYNIIGNMACNIDGVTILFEKK